MATSATGTYSKLTTLGSSTLNYTKTGLSSAKTYYFKVRAYRTGEGVNVFSSYSTAKSAGTAPSVPQISALTGGTGKITLSWEDVSGESKYEVYRATSEKGTYSRITTLNANTTSYTNSGLSAAKTYYYKVRAYRTVNGANVYSSFGSVKYGTTAPSVPVITSAAGGTGKITVKWKAVTGASGYALYMATSASGTYSKVTTLGSSTLSYTKTGVTSAKTYYFKIRAYRSSGGSNVYSGHSSFVSGGTATAPPQIATVTGGTGKITLTWKDVSGESKYQVYRATSEKGTYSRVATLNANTKSYTNTGLFSAKTYFYKIRTYRVVNGANVYSGYSSAVSGETKYQVYMSSSNNGKYSLAATLNANTKSYTKTGLTSRKTYYFKIRTYRTVNGKTVYSSFSPVKSVTPT